MTNWQHLESIDQFQSFIKNSFKYPVLIFKNGTRCIISAMAKMRVKDQLKLTSEKDIAIYCLDVTIRDISNQIEQKFSVQHESPQLLLIQAGQCTYYASHFNIHLEDLRDLI